MPSQLSSNKIFLLLRTVFVSLATIAFLLTGSCDFGPDEYKQFDIVNNLDEPVRMNIHLVDLDESLPFDLNRIFDKDPSTDWPNKDPHLRDIGVVWHSGTLIPSDTRPQLVNKKVLVSAWADEGRMLFQIFIEWDQLFIGSDEILTLVMTPK